MTITVRLTETEERALKEAMRALSVNRSEVVRHAIARYCEEKLRERNRRPYDDVAEWVGCAHSGKGDLASRAHEQYGKHLHASGRTRSR